VRIVLDTNVLISALLFGGNPREILDRVIRGEVILCLSEPILTELGNVLQRYKFGFPHTIVNQIVTELSAISELVLPEEKIQEIKADEADNHVLECAVEAHADYIVSGDSHLLELKKCRSIQVVSPQQFLSLHKK
jgi:putative PIN family toxin of toxin-antitoxin system